MIFNSLCSIHIFAGRTWSMNYEKLLPHAWFSSTHYKSVKDKSWLTHFGPGWTLYFQTEWSLLSFFSGQPHSMVAMLSFVTVGLVTSKPRYLVSCILIWTDLTSRKVLKLHRIVVKAWYSMCCFYKVNHGFKKLCVLLPVRDVSLSLVIPYKILYSFLDPHIRSSCCRDGLSL